MNWNQIGQGLQTASPLLLGLGSDLLGNTRGATNRGALLMGQQAQKKQQDEKMRQALIKLGHLPPDNAPGEVTSAPLAPPGSPMTPVQALAGAGLHEQALAAATAAPDPWRNKRVVGGSVVQATPNGVKSIYQAPQSERPLRIIEGADGRKYYETGQPVLPNVTPAAPKPSAAQQAIQDLMGSDPSIDYATAVGIVRGRLALDSFSGQVIDKATGQPWAKGGVSPSSPENAELPKPIVPTEGADYPGATGGQGIVGSLANTVADFVGGDLPAPEQERASQAFDNLRVRTMTTLQEAVPGRPSNMVIELLGQMTVEGGRITMGAERAKERLAQTRDFIKQDVEKLERILDPESGFSRNQRANARMQLEDRRQLLSDYNAIIEQFNAPASQSSAYPDGFLIENDAGDRMIMRNGQWEPVQ